MGIGEPLNNYEQVMKAIRILRDRRGMNFPTTGITLSSIGIPKALAQLREEHLAINLTISLHATTQEVRDRLIPGSRKHDINEVIARASSWAERHNRIVTFVYLVLPGINDTLADAKRLAGLMNKRRARVNLMRWNPVDGIALDRTSDRSLGLFREMLDRAGVAGGGAGYTGTGYFGSMRSALVCAICAASLSRNVEPRRRPHSRSAGCGVREDMRTTRSDQVKRCSGRAYLSCR